MLVPAVHFPASARPLKGCHPCHRSDLLPIYQDWTRSRPINDGPEAVVVWCGAETIAPASTRRARRAHSNRAARLHHLNSLPAPDGAEPTSQAEVRPANSLDDRAAKRGPIEGSSQRRVGESSQSTRSRAKFTAVGGISRPRLGQIEGHRYNTGGLDENPTDACAPMQESARSPEFMAHTPRSGQQ